MKTLVNRLRALRRAWRGSAKPFLRAILNGGRFVAVDVGGAHGLQPHWHTLDGSARIYSFEPHPQSFADLERHFQQSPHRDLYTVLPFALSGTGGARTLYLTNVPTGSSILPPKRDFIEECGGESYFYPCRETPIETRTLEAVLDEIREPAVDAIKLDIQGAELEVLQGLGAKRLGKLVLAEMEIGLHPSYCGAPQFGEIDGFMKEHGLEMFDVRVARNYRPLQGDSAGYQEKVFSVYGNSPTIAARAWEFDAVYFRAPGPLLDARDAASLRKLVAAYCVYNYFSEAHHLAERATSRGVFDTGEGDALKQQIVAWHRQLNYCWQYKPNRLLNTVRAALKFLRIEPHLRWAQYTYVDYPNC